MPTNLDEDMTTAAVIREATSYDQLVHWARLMARSFPHSVAGVCLNAGLCLLANYLATAHMIDAPAVFYRYFPEANGGPQGTIAITYREPFQVVGKTRVDMEDVRLARLLHHFDLLAPRGCRVTHSQIVELIDRLEAEKKGA